MTTIPRSRIPADYYNDDQPWFGIYRPASGLWAVQGLTRVYYGGAADQPVPANLTGNGGADFAVFRGGSGLWSVREGINVYYGTAGDVAVVR